MEDYFCSIAGAGRHFYISVRYLILLESVLRFLDLELKTTLLL